MRDHVTTEVEWAYCAGVVDGEGCLTILGDGGAYRGYLIVAMSDPACLRVLRRVLGGRLYAQRRRSVRRSGERSMEQLHVSGADLIECLPRLLPYLVGKRDQAELLVSFLVDCPPCQGRAVTGRERAVRESYWALLRELKRAA